MGGTVPQNGRFIVLLWFNFLLNWMIMGTHILEIFYILQHGLCLIITPFQPCLLAGNPGTEGWRSQIASAEQAEHDFHHHD